MDDIDVQKIATAKQMLWKYLKSNTDILVNQYRKTWESIKKYLKAIKKYLQINKEILKICSSCHALSPHSGLLKQHWQALWWRCKMGRSDWMDVIRKDNDEVRDQDVAKKRRKWLNGHKGWLAIAKLKPLSLFISLF